jgi:hypothetical protein
VRNAIPTLKRKNEWHWLGKLRAGCLPAQLAGCQPNATRFLFRNFGRPAAEVCIGCVSRPEKRAAICAGVRFREKRAALGWQPAAGW